MKKTIVTITLALLILGAGCGNQVSSTPPDESCVIKGNVSSSGEKIYHMPNDQFYSQTVIDKSNGEKWFCSEEEARDAGWRHTLR